MKRKRFAAAALAGVMLLCAGCGQEEEAEEEAPSGTAVEVMEVTSGPMSAEYSLTGKVVAVSEVQVFPLLAGQVQTLSVEEGDTVSRGQTLFTVDTSTVTSTMGALQQSYSATKAATDRAIESAQLGVEQAELGVEQAQQAVDNAEALLEVAASVAEDVYMDIRKGDNAGVVISALSDDMVNGTISEVPAAANAQTSLYDVSVSLPADVKPPIGAFATVTFYTDRRSDTISVPTEAILTGADDEQYVFVVDTYAEGDTAVRVTVETGLVSNTDTEILSGLAEGDRVVVKGQSYLSDGAAVRIVTGEDDLPADTADTAADAGGEG